MHFWVAFISIDSSNRKYSTGLRSKCAVCGPIFLKWETINFIIYCASPTSLKLIAPSFDAEELKSPTDNSREMTYDSFGAKIKSHKKRNEKQIWILENKSVINFSRKLSTNFFFLLLAMKTFRLLRLAISNFGTHHRQSFSRKNQDEE